MGGLFSKPKAPTPPPPPKPAIEEATFKPGEGETAGEKAKRTKLGKKRLQIGTAVSGGSGLNTGV